MKKLIMILGIILLFAAIYFIVFNFDNYIGLKFTDFSGNFHTKDIRLSTYTFAILMSGLIAGAGTVNLFLSAQKDKLKAYKRELEKTSISGTDKASRVEVLEAKIETLEKAFNTVIDERKQLELQIKSLNSELDKINKNK